MTKPTREEVERLKGTTPLSKERLKEMCDALRAWHCGHYAREYMYEIERLLDENEGLDRTVNELFVENERLFVENGRLKAENKHIRAYDEQKQRAIDGYVNRLRHALKVVEAAYKEGHGVGSPSTDCAICNALDELDGGKDATQE